MHEEYPLYANVLCWYSVLGNKKTTYILSSLYSCSKDPTYSRTKFRVPVGRHA